MVNGQWSMVNGQWSIKNASNEDTTHQAYYVNDASSFSAHLFTIHYSPLTVKYHDLFF